MLDVFWIWHWEIQHMPFEFLMLKMFTCGVFWEIYLQIQVIDNFSSSSRPRTASYTSFDSSWPSSLWTTVKILQYRNMWYWNLLTFLHLAFYSLSNFDVTRMHSFKRTTLLSVNMCTFSNKMYGHFGISNFVILPHKVVTFLQTSEK